MGKTKQGQGQDQVETKEDPQADTVGSAPTLAKNAAKPPTNEIGLRTQGDVGNKASKPVAKTEPAIAQEETADTDEGPGNLRSQGTVALKEKAEPAKFSNVHMRSELAKKAATSQPERAEAASPASKSVPASKELAEGKPQFKAEAKVKKAAPIIAPKSKDKTEATATAGAPKTGLDVEQDAPTISLKVAVQMDDATLVINPKSKVTLDDAADTAPKPETKPGPRAVATPKPDAETRKAAPIAPKAEVKSEKAAPATGPTVEIRHDKPAHVARPKPDIGTTKTTPLGAPKGGVALAKKETIKAEPEIPTSSEGDAPFEDTDMSEAEGDDLQDTAERTEQTGSLTERRHRRTRELRTHHEAKEEPSS